MLDLEEWLGRGGMGSRSEYWTFLVQRCLELHSIPFRVEVGKRPHRSEGPPGHVLWKCKVFIARVTKDSGFSINAHYSKMLKVSLVVIELRVSQICSVVGWVRTDSVTDEIINRKHQTSAHRENSCTDTTPNVPVLPLAEHLDSGIWVVMKFRIFLTENVDFKPK